MQILRLPLDLKLIKETEIRVLTNPLGGGSEACSSVRALLSGKETSGDGKIWGVYFITL